MKITVEEAKEVIEMADSCACQQRLTEASKALILRIAAEYPEMESAQSLKRYLGTVVGGGRSQSDR